MNPIVITIIVATAAFILSIFGTLQYYSQRMEKYIDAKIEGVNGKIDGLRGENRAGFDAVSNRIASLESRVERIERQLDQIFKPALPKSGD